MQRSLTFIILAVALGLDLDPAMALGLGKTLETATLGRPLNFTVALSTDGDDTPIDSRCVKATVLVGERHVPADDIQTRLERQASTGERQIRVITSQPMEEPVVSVTLSIGCPARFTRMFTVFADPPLLTAQAGHQEPTVAESPFTQVDRTASVWDGVVPPDRMAPLPSSRPARAAAAKPPRSARGEASAASAPARTPRKAAAPKPRPAAAPRPVPAAAAGKAVQARPTDTAIKPAIPPAAVAVKPAPSGAVLQLDPGAELLLSPPLRISTEMSAPDPANSASAAAAVSDGDGDAAQRLKDEAQLVALEQAVRQLQEDHKTRQKALNEMTARTQVLNSRPDGRLVYPLAALCGVLAVTVGAMAWLRRRDRQRAGWWSASSMLWPPGEVASSSHGPLPSPSVLGTSDDGPVLAPDSVSHIDVDIPEQPARRAEAPSPEPFARKDESAFDEPQPLQARRPMTAEELIDLEQQVDFFVALGQDEAAIDLMMGHVRNTGGSSPLPYMKLIEIYRRRNERAPYDRIRDRFNRKFNAHAPRWGIDPESGQQLEDYTEVMSRLEVAWNSPSAAVALLDVLLFKRDAGPTFDVPAYRSLVFLYGIARELSQPEDSETVDLLL
jgi:pilus assembly protein FimV